MKSTKITIFVFAISLLVIAGFWIHESIGTSTSPQTGKVNQRLGKAAKLNPEKVSKNYKIGQVVDSLNNVYVYYNGKIGHVSGRNLASDGYNLGLKYQCVEFVKRYYYEHLNHKMPNSYGHAKDFFEPLVADGQINPERNLIQYHNPGSSMPKVNDLIVFKGTTFNKYGHVAIISKVLNDQIEIIQQNPGPLAHSRRNIDLFKKGRKWKIDNHLVLGWLRKH
ncbi:MAG: CHAP domain-containing protein [Bacteroidales bacterium]|nr:CHAP domain-containing protein [Bacteroidales bacterium]